VINVRSDRFGIIRDRPGGDRHDRRASLEIERIDLVVGVTRLVMDLALVAHVDPQIQHRNALQHERAVLRVVRRFHR
jgi:hypothetical protein